MIAIIVISHGWVLVGELGDRTETELLLNRPHCVRRWGTTRGLGEIALGGPTKSTELEPHGLRVRIVRAHILQEIECAEKPWAKVFK